MIFRVFFILCFMISSCKKEDESKPYNITISGVVTDQVTGQPVEGATVSLGFQSVSFAGEGLISPARSTSTDSDGRYNFVASAEPYNPHYVSPGSYQKSSIALIASKPGYIGSDRREMNYYGAHNSVMDLQLFHSSELNLHITNDTTTGVDKVDIKLVKPVNVSRIIVLTIDCNEKTDSTYVIKNLFGNWEYEIQVMKPGDQSLPPIIEYKLTLKPDTVNRFEIAF